jgi:NADPH:quinone reductase-like Zn-dependent oxidoreductase
MKLRYKILNSILAVFVAAIAALAIALSHSSACEPAPALADGTETMNAIVQRCYGTPEDLSFEKVAKPVPDSNQVLVRIVAAGVNPLDWHFVRGTPYLVRLMAGLSAPDHPGLGVDYAGVVESVGSEVTRFKPGDEVFGGGDWAYSEYMVANENGSIVIKPAEVSFEQAAAVPIAAITAIQALRDMGRLEPGQSVLINGASGGVGTFAVQIAKSMGAEVTGVCSTRNVAMVSSLGADFVLDYKKEDYTELDKQYDLILDMVSNHSLTANRRALKTDGIFVIVGGGKGNWLGPMMTPIKAMLMSPFIDQEIALILAQMEQSDLTILANMMQSGDLKSVIDSRFKLRDVPAAMVKSEEGHTRGKMVINVE